ncbi:MAG: hypothetical protein RL701_4774 [Pseudomonadota bacterium]|jgi:hypothetical protein
MTPDTAQEAALDAPCCPRFDSAKFKPGELEWRDEIFAKVHVKCFFHVPIIMAQQIMRASADIAAAGAEAATPLMLIDEISPWASDVYIRVSKPVSGLNMTTLPGTYMTRLFEGGYRQSQRWTNAMRQYVAERNRHMVKLYFAYGTCPRCAKIYRENYVVLYAQVEPRNESPTTQSSS